MSLALAYSELGEGPPVLILHGLFGWKRNWASIAKGLSLTHRVFLLDMRNHGESPHADEMTYPAMAGDIAEFIESKSLGPCPVIGHSMGGKAAMMLALSRPELVERLLVLDISPVAYDHDYSDYVTAMKSIDFAQISRRGDVEPKIAPVVDNPGILSFLMQNLTTNANGQYTWRVNLGAIERDMGEILDFPNVDNEQAYAGTVLFLGGRDSAYIGPSYLGEIERLFPFADVDFIDNAGHWVHAEQPMATFERFKFFLA